MKKLLFIVFMLFSSLAISQGPPPPGMGEARNDTNKINGSASMGDGIIILLILGSLYGGIKSRKEQK